jgi:hypothetical protein
MKRATISLSLALALAGACGGNYSNEDLDFQLALPAQEDIAVRLPVRTEVPDPAEYYRTTRDVIRVFNGIGTAFLDLIDAVRAYPPSQRLPGHRVWGPFPNREHPGWQGRLVIDRTGDALAASFTYSIDVRPVLGAGDWIPLITGNVRSAGGVRRGEGQMVLATAAARAAGYPLGDLAGWETLAVDYRTVTFPIGRKLTLVNHPAGERLVYSYDEAADGSGSMVFDFPTPALAPFATLAQISSRWNAAGAGRADFHVVEGLRARASGVDCWDPDGRATYVQRELEAFKNSGSPATCVFPPP